MNQIEITNGSRKVIAFRNDEASKWDARLYVNRGETATLTCGKFKTEKGLRKWANKVLGIDAEKAFRDAIDCDCHASAFGVARTF